MAILQLHGRDSDDTTTPPPSERIGQKSFYAIIWTMTAVSFLFLLFRISVRIKSFKKLYLDDYLVIAAWLMLLTSSVIFQVKMHIWYWQYDVTSGKTLPSLSFLVEYGTFMPHVITWTVLFYTCLWSVKLSFLLFFRRLGNTHVKSHKIWWWIVFAFTLISLFACIGDFDFKCGSSDMLYIMTQCTTLRHTKFQQRTFYANMVIDIVTDLLIISVPVLMLWTVQIPMRKKIILYAIFSVTVVIMIIAIIRVTLVKSAQTMEQNYPLEWLYAWSTVENGVAIIVACVASFRVLFVTGQKTSANGQTSSHRRRNILSWFSFTRISSRRDDSNFSGGKSSTPYSQSPDVSETRTQNDTRYDSQYNSYHPWQYQLPQHPQAVASWSSEAHPEPIPRGTVHIQSSINLDRGPAIQDRQMLDV